MESNTFRTRVVALVQKSRRALRLYSNPPAGNPVKVEILQAELSQAQVQEWKNANTVLLSKLGRACESPNTKELVYHVFALRNEFQSVWRASETELALKQRDLLAAAERGDFIKATTLAADLVSLKARVQAGQAVHHELDTLIKKTRISHPLGASLTEELETIKTIELLDEHVVTVSELPVNPSEPLFEPTKMTAAGGSGKIIPLKRR